MQDEARGEDQRTVGRMIKLLELFGQQQRPLSSADITAGLDAPRSSVAGLLKALVEQGVLSIDRRAATYFPTARLAPFGTWMAGAFIADEQVRELLANLQRQTGETVLLTTPVDLALEVVDVVLGTEFIALLAKPGQRFQLWGSAVGSAYLTGVPKATIASMYERAVRGTPPGSPSPIPLKAVMEMVEHTRRQGYIMKAGAVEAGVAAVAAPLPAWAGPRPLVISIGGPERRIEAKEAVIRDTLLHGLSALKPPSG